MKLLPKSLVAIFCITALVIVALLKDIDGALLATAMTIIAGLGGYTVGRATSNKP